MLITWEVFRWYKLNIHLMQSKYLTKYVKISTTVSYEGKW